MQRSMMIITTAVLIWVTMGAPLGARNDQTQASQQTQSAAAVPAATLKATPPPATRESVASVIGLNDREIETLDRIYEKYAAVRLAHESQMVSMREELENEEKDTPRNVRRIASLKRDIKNMEQRIASAFWVAHATAFRELMDNHRDHLRTLPSDPESFVDDKYRQLLVMKPEDLWSNPVDDKAANQMLTRPTYLTSSPSRYRYFSAPRVLYRGYGYRYYGPQQFFRRGTAHVYVLGRYFRHAWR